MKQIKVMSKKEKKDCTAAAKEKNSGAAEDEEFRVQKAKLHRPNRKRMTIREINSKESPFQGRAKLEFRVRCPSEGCVKNFVYEGALANHIYQKHGHDYTSIEAAQSVAHAAFERGVARALRAHLEDNGVEIPQTASLIPQLDEDGLAQDDPECLDHDFEGEEEVLQEGVGMEITFDLIQPEDLLLDEISADTLLLMDEETLAEYEIAPLPHLVGVGLPPGTPIRDLFRPPEPPLREYPPPVNIADGQRVRPVLIDFEINDFRHSEPIEMTVRCLITGQVYSTLINCENAIHFRAWQVHHISRAMLRGFPYFPDVYKELEHGSRQPQTWSFDPSNLVVSAPYQAPGPPPCISIHIFLSWPRGHGWRSRR